MSRLVDQIKARLAGRAPAFLPLLPGHDALAARLALIEMAEQSIDAQYYIYRRDTVGLVFTEYLLRAADRGVRVRLLIDDTNTAFRNRFFAEIDQYPNVSVRAYNPFRLRGWWRLGELLLDFARVNRRMHNKALIVDGRLAVVGGRNIGDEYYSRGAVQFADLDMLLVNGAVAQLQQLFNRYWTSRQVEPLAHLLPLVLRTIDKRKRLARQLRKALATDEAQAYLAALARAHFLRRAARGKLRWFQGEVKVYADPPDKGRHNGLLSLLRPLVDAAREQLLIISPYFVPGRRGVDYLARRVCDGLSVTVLTNSLAATDVSAVHAGYARYRRKLLAAGVSLLEAKPFGGRKTRKQKLLGRRRSSLHAKTYVVDNRYVFVGSLNMDPRSFAINTETLVVFDAPELAQELTAALADADDHYRLALAGRRLRWFDADNDTGPPDYAADPASSLGLRLWIQVLKLLPIERQL